MDKGQIVTGRRILVTLENGRWMAMFDRGLPLTFGGNTVFVAIRRLLETTEASPGEYRIQVEVSDAAVPDSIRWDPPLMMVRCPECEGKRQYVGLRLVEQCRACTGRGMVSI